MGRLVWAFSPGAERTYYTLRPSFSDSSERVYVPVEKADASLKNVMTEKEAQTYLENFGKMQVKPTLTNKAPMLAAHYRELLSSCNVSDHLRLYKEIYEKEALAVKNGKKIGATEQQFMKKVTHLLSEEFAIALHESPESSARRLEELLHA